MNMNYLNFSHTTTYHDQRVPFLTSTSLDKLPMINHGFSTRLGGVSSGMYTSMNLSFTRGDAPDLVTENFRRMGHALHMDMADMVYAHQTHTIRVLEADSSHRGMGILKERNFMDYDGLITNEKHVVLVTSYADCVPLFIVDPVKQAIGLSHSGWKGTVGNIGGATVMKMQETYGSDPKDLVVFIGPSICRNCYEVSEDVAEAFADRYGPDVFREILFPKMNGKFQLDLHQANRANFRKAGVPDRRISLTDLCTCCNPDLLYSHRASKGERGGLCGFLELI